MTTFDFRVKFTIGAGIVLTVVGSAVVFAYAKYENLRKVLEFGTTVAAAVAGLTGASYAAQSLTRGAEEAKIDRTLSFISRWNDPGFEKKQVINLLRQLHDKANSEVKIFILDEVDQDNVLKAEINTILNFFEEMSLAINSKLVDENILRSFFGGIVMTYVDKFNPWIKHRREVSNREDVFKSLTALDKKWKNRS